MNSLIIQAEASSPSVNVWCWLLTDETHKEIRNPDRTGFFVVVVCFSAVFIFYQNGMRALLFINCTSRCNLKDIK